MQSRRRISPSQFVCLSSFHRTALIYVDPEGVPLGDVQGTAEGIREVFGRMGFDDRLTVSVIGGGHAYGKAHGACSAAEADSEGFCNGGTSWEDKFTSGLEVTWNEAPTVSRKS